MDLEKRIARLEDRAAIADLVVSYFLAADGDDLDGVGSSFSETATFSSSGQINATGRAQIVEFIRGARQHMGLTVHTPHYSQVTFDGEDAASGLVGAHLELVVGGTAVFGAVRYVDKYERVGGLWRISSRDMRTIYMAPWLGVGDALTSDLPVQWPGTAAAASDYPRRSVD